MPRYAYRFLCVTAGATVAAIALSSALLLGMGEAAAAQAEMIEQRLRNAGIRLTPEDVKAIQTIENHRKKFQQMYRELDAYEDAYTRKKTTARVAEIQKHKEAMRVIGRQLPSADATVGGYYLEVRRYLSGPSAKSAERMRAIEAALKKYGTEIDAKTGVEAIPVPTAPVRSRFDDYVFTLLSLSGEGEMEYYVNGVKLTSLRQDIPLKGNQVVTIRAVALDSRRRQSRDFRGGPMTELLEQTDYRLKYRVKSGNFTGMTLWTPIKERYTWGVGPAQNPNATFKVMTSSFDFALEDDVIAFRYNGNFTTSVTVSSQIEWKGESQLPTGERVLSSKGSTKGSLTFNIGPG